MVSSAVQLTLIGKPGCHLCDDARTALNEVLASDEVVRANLEIALEELNMLDDAALTAKYAEEIPVLLIDGRMHSYWHIDPKRLTAALLKKSETKGISNGA